MPSWAKDSDWSSGDAESEGDNTPNCEADSYIRSCSFSSPSSSCTDRNIQYNTIQYYSNTPNCQADSYIRSCSFSSPSSSCTDRNIQYNTIQYYSNTPNCQADSYIRSCSFSSPSHGLSQQGVLVPFWTPKPLKRIPQGTQMF